MRVFFSFFGSKWRLAKHYPVPTEKVIEPFAGAAGYSTFWEPPSVQLVDKDPIIVGVWDYLIRSTESEIRSLPIVKHVDDSFVCQEAKWFMGFWLTESQTYPSRYPLSASRGGRWSAVTRARIAQQIHKINHWKVKQGCYSELTNEEATWFVDPPYASAGKRYKFKTIDYDHLARWVKTRKGTVIVCEQAGASWLPFRPLTVTTNGSNKQNFEAIWP
jgi:site-specific DNA-adenine methylase